MRKFYFIFLFLPLFIFGEVHFTDFDRYQDRWTRQEIEEKLGLFLQKDAKLSSYFSVNNDTFILYNAPDSQKDREVEFCLRFAKEKKNLEKETKKRDLVGLKIAIDPGHFGGPYARLEERYIDIPPSLERDQQIQFDEGTLSLLTATYLKVLLEKEGAIVMLTRDRIGEGVYQQHFFDWLGKNPRLWSGEISLSKLFRKYYNPLDLRARAQKINEFCPDLTVVIHFNSHHVEQEDSSNHCITPHNYNLVFIPGAFCRGELTEHENRYEFLRLLLSEDLHRSLSLSRTILASFNKKLGVPIVSKADDARYLDRVCLKLEEGIFSRNLAMTRLVHSPICYGETLVQNNIDECRNLSRMDFVIAGQKCSSRIKQVAEAYFEGIKEYLLK